MRALTLAPIALALACFEPTIRPGLSCAETGVCPAGQICDPLSRRCASERVSIDASTPGDAAVSVDSASGGAFCASELVLCLEFDGVVADNRAGAPAVEVKGTPSFIDGHRGMAMLGAADVIIEALELFEDLPVAVTFEMWLAAVPVDSLILVDRRVRIELDKEGILLTSRRDGSIVRYGPFPTERYFHIAFLVGDARVELFVDGALVASAAVLLDPISKASLFIANNNDEPGTTPLAGAVDDLRVWPRLLTKDEIATAAARHRGR